MSLIRHPGTQRRHGPLFKHFASGAKVASKVYQMRQQRNRNQLQRISAGPSSQPLTTQRDYKTDYRKRRMTRKSKFRYKRKKRFVRGVRNAYLQLFQVPQEVAVTDCYNVSAAASQCAQFDCFVNSVDGFIPAALNNYRFDDWRVIFRAGGVGYQHAWDNALQYTTGANNPALPAIPVRGRKIYFKNCVGEITVKNTGSNQCFVNGYLCVARKDMPDGGGIDQPTKLYTDGFIRAGQVSDDATLGTNAWTTDTQVIANSWEATPFNNPQFCRFFKILKRTKFNLGAGQDFSMIVKSMKPRMVEMSSMATNTWKKGFTYGWFFDMTGAPTAVPGTEACSVTVHFARRYRIQLMPQAAQETAILKDL
jgi:hypothetical protein